jgi:hypothetical protein
VTATVTATSGRLIRNTQRHPTLPTSQPPRNGPMALATPPRPDQAPTALDRSSGANEDWMMASEPGVSSAPPIPSRAREAISIGALTATAHSADASANHTSPMTKIRRLPYLSPSAPPSRIIPASVSV